MNPNLQKSAATTGFQIENEPDDERLYPVRNFDDDDEAMYPVVTEDEMGETAKHYKQIAVLFSLLEAFFAARSDVLVAANMSLYYDEGAPSKWLAPDLMVCFGVSNEPRRVYRAWQEKIFPQVVFEVASEATVENDLGKKYLEYNRLGAEEYYLLDPERAYLPAPFLAYQLDDSRLKAVQIQNNRVFSPRLNLEIVDTNSDFKLFDPTENVFLQSLEEAQAEIKRLRALLDNRLT